jgi:hypothetical protein
MINPRFAMPMAFLLLIISAAAAAQPAGPAWWAVEVPVGQYNYRYKPEGKGQTLTNYTPLYRSSEIQCKSAPCKLRVADLDSDAGLDLNITLVAGRWVSLRTAKPDPRPVIVAQQPELLKELQDRSKPASRDKDGPAGCGGTITLLAPVCGEAADIDSFSVEWKPVAGQSGKLTLIADPLDLTSTQVGSFRVLVDMSAGRFEDASLRQFFRRIQRPDAMTAVRLRLLKSEEIGAFRILNIPSLQQDAAFKRQLSEAAVNHVFASLQQLAAAIQHKRLSLAAQAAKVLESEAKDSEELQSYALLGLCDSGYAERRESLRAQLSSAGINGLCDNRAAEDSAFIAAAARPPAGNDTQTGGNKPRLGVAVLIGNSDYPNDNLDAVRNDIEGMEEALTALGFETATLRNLDSADDFRKNIAHLLQQKKAASDDIVLIYYSGHGMQVNGKSYLLGVNYAKAGAKEAAAFSHAMSLNDLVAQLEDEPMFARVLIVDACRNNTFSRAAEPNGSVTMKSNFANTFVLFANLPGRPAASRAEGGMRSPFTEGLIYGMASGRKGIADIFAQAAAKTRQLNPQQEPQLYTSQMTDPILSESYRRVRTNRPAQLLQKACPLYYGRAWDSYLELMRVARTLAVDDAVLASVSREISFAEHAKKAGEAAKAKKYADSAQSWKQAVELYPGRSWARLEAVVAALMEEDLEFAIGQLSFLSKAPDEAVAAKARTLLSELSKTQPAAPVEPVLESLPPDAGAEPKCETKDVKK